MEDNTRAGLERLAGRLNPGQYITVEVAEMRRLFRDAQRLLLADSKLREFEIEWDGSKYVFTPRVK